MSAGLFELRDRLVTELLDLPGFRTVGIGKQGKKLVLVVSVDSEMFEGGVPPSFGGHKVKVRDLGRAVGHLMAV
jgi:hypothetical protein